MSVKTRQGRKTVTIITGLETFGVDVEDFAEELRKLCAGSASSGFILCLLSFRETKIDTQYNLSMDLPKD